MGVREQGTVKWFDGVKRYGFIAGDSGKDVFVHGTGINGRGYTTLRKGERVSFLIRDEAQKGPRAVGVRVIDEGKNLDAGARASC